MRETFVQRVRLISVLIIIFVALLLLKLYFVQIVHGDEYASKADRQYVRPQEGIFERGDIFFTEKDGGHVAAATIKSGFALSINPSRIDSPNTLYGELTNFVDLEEEAFLEHTEDTTDPYEVVANYIAKTTADAIIERDLEGVSLYREQWRYYPGETLAAQTIGFVAYQSDEQVGSYGVERYYEDVLKRSTSETEINFFAEVFSNIADVLNTDELRGEGDVILTIEPTVQAALEEHIRGIVEAWGSKSAGGIIINPVTGEIYALAVRPTFNLNQFSDVANTDYYSNPLVESIFEMGSIIKPLTMAAGLDAGAVVPESTYYDAGYLDLDNGRETISNYDGRGRGTVDMYQVLGESLNTGAAYVVGRMGNKNFANYMNNYGLGKETGIDLPGEIAGQLANLESPRDVEYATASFGQGIAMTPIATVRALASLANGGRLITPHVAQRVEYENGLSKKIFYNLEEGAQVLKPETSETITKMLVNVTDNFLLGGTVKMDRYSIAAKTGTAQIANPYDGGYYDDRFLHSFFGYFPAYDPTFLIFLFNEEPVGARYASETLTHPFIDLTKFLISYYEIPPDR